MLAFKILKTLWDDLGHPVMTSTKFSGNAFASTHDDHEIITGEVLEELNSRFQVFIAQL